MLNPNLKKQWSLIILMVSTVALYACAPKVYVPANPQKAAAEIDYRIGPGDLLEIFVWRNQEVSISIPVRPDGKISTPLVEDMVAEGKTPTQLARDIERELSVYLKEPLVTVIVRDFIGPFNQQIRVVGEAAQPAVLPYRANMTVLDVMIAVGGLTEFANGNGARIIRTINGKNQTFGVRLDNLIREGDINANVAMLPGDILIIPESWF